MSTDPATLEFTADEMRHMGYATIERLMDYILSLKTQPARGDVAAADLCRRRRSFSSSPTRSTGCATVTRSPWWCQFL